MTIPGGFLDGDVLEAADVNTLPGGIAGGGRAAGSNNQTSIGSTPTVVSDLVVTFTAQADRLYRISFAAALQQVSSNGTAAAFIGKAGSTFQRVWQGPLVTSTLEYVSGWTYDFPGAGSVSYSLMLNTSAGTLTYAGATARGVLIVEDMGVEL